MVVGCLGAIAIGGAIVVINVATSSNADDGGLPAELSVASLSKAGENGDRREVFRGVMDRDDLTDDQRRQAFRNMREVRRKMMQARMSEYFDATSDEEKQAILDEQIDEFAKMREQWRQRREERDANGNDDRERMRELFQSRTQQERKAQSEDRNPDETARSMAYFSAMRSRMSQRGMSMGGGRGGSGGGRGSRP